MDDIDSVEDLMATYDLYSRDFSDKVRKPPDAYWAYKITEPEDTPMVSNETHPTQLPGRNLDSAPLLPVAKNFLPLRRPADTIRGFRCAKCDYAPFILRAVRWRYYRARRFPLPVAIRRRHSRILTIIGRSTTIAIIVPRRIDGVRFLRGPRRAIVTRALYFRLEFHWPFWPLISLLAGSWIP